MLSVKSSLASTSVSPNTGTVSAARVWPSAKVSVPDVLSKSSPATAEPDKVS